MALTAAHASRCPDCDSPIKVGQLIESSDTGWIHVECPPERPTAAPCPTCFQVPASNGDCGCDR